MGIAPTVKIWSIASWLPLKICNQKFANLMLHKLQTWRFYQWILGCHERFSIKHLKILCHTIYKHTDNEKETQSGCNSKLGVLIIAPSYFILTIWSYHGTCRSGDVWIFEFIDHVKGQPQKRKKTNNKETQRDQV